MPALRVFPDEQSGAVYAAAVMDRVMQARRSPVFGLATGSTQIPLYRQLVRMHRQGLSFATVTTINLDEYVGLSAQSPGSFSAYMERNFFRHVDIPPGARHLPQGDAPDLAAECLRYDALLSTHRLDLQLLGIGINGHIGFNEPSTSLSLKTHVVALQDETILRNSSDFPDGSNVPRQAITVGLQSIFAASAILLLAFGRDKAEAVAESVCGQVRTSCPASLLQLHPRVTYVLDAAAAGRLPDAGRLLALEEAAW
jgi:glucosamine-6-phosphate deaminase